MSRLPGYGAVKTVWVPDASVTAFPTLTAAMLTGGKELTMYELPDTKIAAEGSDTINEKAIGDVADSEVPTFAKYGGSLHLFRSYAAAGALAADDLLATFDGRPFGYYCRRVGKANTVAFAASDVVEAYRFQCDTVQIETNDGGNIKIMVPLLRTGVFKLAITLT